MCTCLGGMGSRRVGQGLRMDEGGLRTSPMHPFMSWVTA